MNNEEIRNGFSVLSRPRGCSLLKQQPGVITNHYDGTVYCWCFTYTSQKKTAESLHFCLLLISAPCVGNVSPGFPPPQLQQAISNHSKTCPEGMWKEDESRKYRQ